LLFFLLCLVVDTFNYFLPIYFLSCAHSHTQICNKNLYDVLIGEIYAFVCLVFQIDFLCLHRKHVIFALIWLLFIAVFLCFDITICYQIFCVVERRFVPTTHTYLYILDVFLYLLFLHFCVFKFLVFIFGRAISKSFCVALCFFVLLCRHFSIFWRVWTYIISLMRISYLVFLVILGDFRNMFLCCIVFCILPLYICVVRADVVFYIFG